MIWLMALWGCTRDPVERLLTPDPAARRTVWAFTSPEGQTWTRQPEPVAYHLASLGLTTDPDSGDLLLTGVLDRLEPPPWERYLGPPIRGLRFDGDRWSPLRLEGTDPEALSYIDPQLLDGEAWYIAPPSSEGDPAHRKEDTPLRSSPPPQTRYAAPGIADPSPLRVDGELHVFLTYNFNILHLAGEPLAPRASILGANVPFPVVDTDGSVRLLAQAARSRTREPVITPYSLQTASEEPLSPDWQPVLDTTAMADLDSCTSPVMAPSPAPEGGWLLLCVEETLDCSTPEARDHYAHCQELATVPDAEQADCSAPNAAALYSNCRSDSTHTPPAAASGDPSPAQGRTPQEPPPPPPPPGTRSPPAPVDCDYPGAAEKDARCRPRADCSLPGAREKYPHCQVESAASSPSPSP